LKRYHNTSALIPVVFLFVLLSGCDVATPLLFDFKLSACPRTEFTLPQGVEKFHWRVEKQNKEVCDGFQLYRLEQLTEPDHGRRKIEGAIYTRFNRGFTCTLSVALSFGNYCGDILNDCPYFRDARSSAERFAITLLSAQNLSPLLPAASFKIFQDSKKFDRWCHTKIF
jgi:hypothetical protein